MANHDRWCQANAAPDGALFVSPLVLQSLPRHMNPDTSDLGQWLEHIDEKHFTGEIDIRVIKAAEGDNIVG